MPASQHLARLLSTRSLASIATLVAASLVVLAFLAPASQSSHIAPCTITWDGSLGSNNAWFAIQPNGSGPEDDITNWSPERFPNSSDHACFPAGANAITLLNQSSPTVGSYEIAAGAILTLQDGDLAARENSANAGTLRFTGAASLSHNDAVASDSEGLLNTGTIHFAAGAPTGSTSRIITGDLVNQGVIDVDHSEASVQNVGAGNAPATVTHTNGGTIDVSPGNALRVLNSTFIHGTASEIQGGGTVNTGNTLFQVSGNSEVAAGTDVNLGSNTTLEGTAGAATGNVDVPFGAFSVDLEGTVPAGLTVDIDSSTLQVEAVDSTVNAGRINLNGGGALLRVLPNDPVNSTSKLTNTGTIEYTPGPAGDSGLRTISGDVVNQGTILVNENARYQRFGAGGNPASKLTNNGTVTVASGKTLTAISGTTFANGTGGVFNGPGAVNLGGVGRLAVSGTGQIASSLDFNLLEGSDLSFESATTGTGNIDIGVGQAALTGDVPAGYGLELAPGAEVRALASYTNAGTISLQGSGSQLQTEDGNSATTETLTNTGTIASSGSGGIVRLSGDLVNQGQLAVAHNQTRFERHFDTTRNPKLTNAAPGTLTVVPGGNLALLAGEAQGLESSGVLAVNGTLGLGNNPLALLGGTLRGGGTLMAGDVNNTGGTVAPGTSPGVLTISEDYTQGAGGTLAIEVSGNAPGTGHDRLVVGGTAALGGTLQVTTSGFAPVGGQQFRVIDAPAPPNAPTVSGSFATVQEVGRDYDVAINPTDVTLTATGPGPPPDSDGDGTPNASDQCPSRAGPASNGGCPVVSKPPDEKKVDQVACSRAKKKVSKAKKALKKLQRRHRKLKKQDAKPKRLKASKKKIAKAKKKVKKVTRSRKKACLPV